MTGDLARVRGTDRLSLETVRGEIDGIDKDEKAPRIVVLEYFLRARAPAAATTATILYTT